MARKHSSASLPAFYLATEDLFIGSPESGAMPVAAFRKGDRVPPAMVKQNGWASKVENPEPEEEVAASPEVADDMPDKAGKE